MTDNLVLLRAKQDKTLYALALAESPWSRQAQVLVRWRGDQLVEGVQCAGPWEWLALGPAVHDLLVELGIFKQMVDLLGMHIATANQRMTALEKIQFALDLEYAARRGGVAPPWA